MAVFMSHCALFWGSRAIYNVLMTRYMLERYDPKLAVFAFYGHFHELLPTVFGFEPDLHVSKDPDMFERYDQKLVVFVFYGRFHELLPIVLGF